MFGNRLPMSLSGFLACVAVASLSLATNYQISGTAPIQRLEVEQSSGGLIIHGLFETRFNFASQMQVTCAGVTGHCYAGSNNPGP